MEKCKTCPNGNPYVCYRCTVCMEAEVSSLEAELKKRDDTIGRIETFIASCGHNTWWDYDIFMKKQEPEHGRR